MKNESCMVGMDGWMDLGREVLYPWIMRKEKKSARHFPPPSHLMGKKELPNVQCGNKGTSQSPQLCFSRPFELTGAGLTWRHPYLET
jgi:hypothetical protein